MRVSLGMFLVVGIAEVCSRYHANPRQHVGWLQARAKPTTIWCNRPEPTFVTAAATAARVAADAWFAGAGPLRPAIVRQQLFFPDRRLLQYDCGKLQVLS